jgi:hypothetical protein
MKNYSALLLSFTFVCAQGMMEEDELSVHIPVVNRNSVLLYYATVVLEPNDSCYDLQDSFREEVGPGNLAYGIYPYIGEQAEQLQKYTVPLLTLAPPEFIQRWINQMNLRFIVNQ